MLKYLRKSPEQDSGFTIVELLATLLLLLAMVQIFVSLVRDINNSTLIRDNLIATNIVQEGVEVARNIRDRDWFLGNSFGTSLPDGAWRIQWNSLALIPLGENPVLKKSASGFFNYDSGDSTVFKRVMTISRISANEIKLNSSVEWNFRGGPKTVSAELHLFNWLAP